MGLESGLDVSLIPPRQLQIEWKLLERSLISGYELRVVEFGHESWAVVLLNSRNGFKERRSLLLIFGCRIYNCAQSRMNHYYISFTNKHLYK